MIDYESIKQRVAKFDEQHGASVQDNGWILFEDGAIREADPVGALMDPPSKAWDLTRRVLHYWSTVLAQAVAEFEERRGFYVRAAKSNLNQQFVGPPPGDPAAAAAELKALQKAVRRAKRGHDAALAAVESSKPAKLVAMEQTIETNRRANQALLDSVTGIEV